MSSIENQNEKNSSNIPTPIESSPDAPSPLGSSTSNASAFKNFCHNHSNNETTPQSPPNKQKYIIPKNKRLFFVGIVIIIPCSLIFFFCNKFIHTETFRSILHSNIIESLNEFLFMKYYNISEEEFYGNQMKKLIFDKYKGINCNYETKYQRKKEIFTNQFSKNMEEKEKKFRNYKEKLNERKMRTKVDGISISNKEVKDDGHLILNENANEEDAYTCANIGGSCYSLNNNARRKEVFNSKKREFYEKSKNSNSRKRNHRSKH